MPSIHLALHGCKQTLDRIGHAFITEAGYDRWADSNKLIVLFPQAHETVLYPKACWNWWGYDNPDYTTRSGRWMAAVHAMLTRLAGGAEPPAWFCDVLRGYNFEHWRAGRAHASAW